MNKQHWFLLILWIMYCVTHSLLADIRLKSKFETLLGTNYKYYRICYSIFAAITLAMVLCFQISLESIQLFHFPIFQYAGGFLLCLPGAYIMIVCIKKYFYELSGIQVLQDKKQEVTLRQDGVHSIVRHPLYFGTLLFVLGLFLFSPLLTNLIATIMIFIYTLIGIIHEEKQLNLEFGDAYKQYARKVPGLLPRLWAKK